MSTTNKPTGNQDPEPVRAWFARLFRRPAPTPDHEAGLQFLSEFTLRMAGDLQQAQQEAVRWKRHADDFAHERDGAYRERAHLLAWLAALHPATTVITPARDVKDEDGWHLLYIVAGGWQMSWHISPRDLPLFRHVELVDPADPQAEWDGHGTEQKYERMRQHVRLLALEQLEARSA
ncbi:hypothetical protein ACFV3F_03655 [Streptomyces sp. NPDC059717]|uniref:hypothetical protein n=1 Tax=Streptomyces sp. NPDC059717 TaxID=3346922 RepID=UPI0036CE5DFF